VKELSVEERAYFAGIVDGEGHFSLRPRPNLSNNSFHCQLEVTTTDKVLSDWIVPRFGGDVYIKQPKDNAIMAYRVNWGTHSELLEIIDQIYDFLVIKKSLALMVKSFCSVDSSDVEARKVFSEIACLINSKSLGKSLGEGTQR